MPFSLSGNVAAGGHAALEEVLQRRLQEELRLQQERRAQEELDLRRQEMAQMQEEREADRKFRQQQADVQTAGRTMARTQPGQINAATAKNILLDPANEGMVTQRKVINARPINAPSILAGAVQPQPAGEMPMQSISAPSGQAAPAAMGGNVQATPDMSGEQDFSVLEPTREQSEKALQDTRFDDITKQYERAATPQQRRVVQLSAIKNKTPLPSDLIGETPEETQAREDKTFGTHSKIEHGYRMEEIGAQAAAQQQLAQAARDAAAKAAKGDPEAKKQITRMAYDAATKLKTSKGLKEFTGLKGWQFAFGLKEKPFAGTDAADAGTQYDTLRSLLAINNLPLLKGPMSDKDVAFIMSMSTALNNAQSDKEFISTLDQIIERLENPTFDPQTGEGYGFGAMRKDDVGPNEPIRPRGNVSTSTRSILMNR